MYDNSIDPRHSYRYATGELYLMIFDGLITDEEFCIQFDLLTEAHNDTFNSGRKTKDLTVLNCVKFAKHGEH